MSWVTIPGLWASYPTSLSFNFLFHEMGVMAVPSHTIVVKIEQGNPTELRGGLDVKREPLGRLPRKREEMLLTEFHVTAARGREGSGKASKDSRDKKSAPTPMPKVHPWPLALTLATQVPSPDS